VSVCPHAVTPKQLDGFRLNFVFGGLQKLSGEFDLSL
jgi:hypothetical protein